MAALFVFVITFYATRFVYYRYNLEWYHLAIFAAVCFAVLLKLFTAIGQAFKRTGKATAKHSLAWLALGVLVGIAYTFLAGYSGFLLVAGGALVVAALVLHFLARPAVPSGGFGTGPADLSHTLKPEILPTAEGIEGLARAPDDRNTLVRLYDSWRDGIVASGEHKTLATILQVLQLSTEVTEQRRKQYEALQALKQAPVKEEAKGLRAKQERQEAKTAADIAEDTSTLQVEIAKTNLEANLAEARKRRDEATTPPQPKPTPEQQRAAERARHEARLKDLDKQQRKAERIKDPIKRERRINLINQEIEQEEERWGKTL